MKSWHLPVGLLAVAIVGALVWTRLDRAESNPPEAVKEHPNERPRLRAPEQVVVRHEVVAIEPPSSPTSPEQPPEPPLPETPQEVAARLDLDFQQETRSVEGRALEENVARGFSAVSGARVDSLECRTSRCKLGLTFDDADADRRALEQVFGPSNSELNMAGVVPVRNVDADGTVHAVVYLFPDAVPSEEVAME